MRSKRESFRRLADIRRILGGTEEGALHGPLDAMTLWRFRDRVLQALPHLAKGDAAQGVRYVELVAKAHQIAFLHGLAANRPLLPILNSFSIFREQLQKKAAGGFAPYLLMPGERLSAIWAPDFADACLLLLGMMPLDRRSQADVVSFVTVLRAKTPEQTNRHLENLFSRLKRGNTLETRSPKHWLARWKADGDVLAAVVDWIVESLAAPPSVVGRARGSLRRHGELAVGRGLVEGYQPAAKRGHLSPSGGYIFYRLVDLSRANLKPITVLLK